MTPGSPQHDERAQHPEHERPERTDEPGGGERTDPDDDPDDDAMERADRANGEPDANGPGAGR